MVLPLSRRGTSAADSADTCRAPRTTRRATEELEEAAQEAALVIERMQENAPAEIADAVDRYVDALMEMVGGASASGTTEATGASTHGGHAPELVPAGVTSSTSSTSTSTTASTTSTTTGESSTTTAAGSGDGSDGDGGGTATTAPQGEGGGEGGAPSEAFLESSADVGIWAADNCADQQIEVVAEDYRFEGLPADAEAGTYGIRLDNQGTEWHEVVLFRKNPGVTMSAEELLALPEEEAMTMVSPAGSAFAAPGGQSGTVVDLAAGDYVAACFIPLGTVSLETEASGPPHFTQGMVDEFTVS